jgi:Glycosyltransferase family 87
VTLAQEADSVPRYPALRRGAVPALVGICAFAVAAWLVHFTRGERLVEYERFGRGILGGAIPYRDFVLEYPPWSIPAFLVPAPGGGGYEMRFRVWMWILGAVSIALLVLLRASAGTDRRSLYPIAAFVGVTPLLFDPSPLFNGFDWWPATLTLVSVALLVRGRRRASAAVLGLAAAAKIYPAILLPLLLLFRRRRLSWDAVRAELAAFAGANFLVNLPFAILGFHGLVYTYSRLVRRPLQIESLAGSLFLAAHRLGLYRATVYVSFGGSEDLAGRLPSIAAPVSASLMGVAVVAVWVVFSRGPRDLEALLTAAAACVAAFIAFGKVFSPEYQVWLIAIVPLVSRGVRLPALALLGTSLVLTQLYFPTRYLEVAQLGAIDWLVVARNLTVVALFVVLLRGLQNLAVERVPAIDYTGTTTDGSVVATAAL